MFSNNNKKRKMTWLQATRNALLFNFHTSCASVKCVPTKFLDFWHQSPGHECQSKKLGPMSENSAYHIIRFLHIGNFKVHWSFFQTKRSQCLFLKRGSRENRTKLWPSTANFRPNAQKIEQQDVIISGAFILNQTQWLVVPESGASVAKGLILGASVA